MKKLVPTLLFVLLIGFLSSCQEQVKPLESHKIKGLWTLHIMEKFDPETGKWNEWRDGMQGYILYDAKENMALHLTTKGYEKTDLRFPNFVDTIATEALQHLTNSYVYFAKYSIDEEEGIVQHARISHSNPGLWNEIVQRRFSFSGDTLVLQPVEKQISGLRLKWIRN